MQIGHENSTTTTNITQELGTKIFGNKVGIAAKDVVIKGGDVVAKELVQINATDSVTITAATNTYSTKHDEDKSMLGISAGVGSGVSLNSSASTLHTTQTATTSNASTISGSTVNITSGGNTTIQASNVIADKDVNVTAGGNIDILAAQNTETSTSQSTSNNTSIGLAGGASARQTIFSSTKTAGNFEGTSTTNTTSVLSANGGNLNLNAKDGTVTVQGAELLAKDKVAIKAQDVDLQAITNASSSNSHFESSSFTVGAALAGTVGSKITAISDLVQTAGNTSNDRLKGAATLKAGYDSYKLATGGATKATADAKDFRDSLGKDGAKGDPNSGSAFGISVSVGINSSKQDNSSATTQSRGTSIQAKDIEITATGGGTGSTTGGNITATGAKLQAENISLDATKDIHLQAAVNTNNIKSSNESHSLGGGVTFGVGQQSGISFQFNAGQANGNTNGTEVGYDNTLVTATNKLTVKSGGNTNLVGAQLAGNTVKMDVGGDLNVLTLQDKSDFKSEQHSSGFSVSVCAPPICYGSAPVTGSISKSDATIDHNYQSATGQSGIAAGSGGYDITVKGNTDLKGGAITSTAPKDKNTLATGSITSSDLSNAQNTSSESSSISLSYSGSSSAMSNVANNVSSNILGHLSAGAGLPANGSQSGVTQSVISPGNVTITGTGDATKDANSNTQVATLTTRDASKANGSLMNTLTLQQAQEIPAQQQRAAENAQAANLAGAAMDGMIGDISQANGWKPGSPQATILHGFSGMAQAAIGGINLGTGFTSGALNEQLVQPMANYIAANCDSCVVKNKDGSTQLDANGHPVLNQSGKDLLLAGSTMVGAGSTAALGGRKVDVAAGANIAKNSTEFNYLNHDNATLRETLRDKQRKGGTLTAGEQQTLDNLNILDMATDLALKDACKTPGDECNSTRRDLNSAVNSYSGTIPTNPALSAAGNAGVRAELDESIKTGNDPTIASQTTWDAIKEFAVPQLAGYAVGAVFGKYIAEARAVYTAIRSEATVASGQIPIVTKGAGGSGEIIGELNPDGTVTLKTPSTSALPPPSTPAATNGNGQTVGDLLVLPGSSKGNLRVLPGATPDVNELRAAQGLTGLGLNVDLQPTAQSRGLPGRTADMGVSGYGQIDVYTPKATTSPNMIIDRIANKNDQAIGVLVQTDLPLSTIQNIATETWANPSSPNISVLFFQRTDGAIVRIYRPGTKYGK